MILLKTVIMKKKVIVKMKWIRVILKSINIVGKLLFIFPKGFLWRRKAINSFEKELKKADIEKEVIEKLSAEYKELGKINNWQNTFGTNKKDEK